MSIPDRKAMLVKGDRTLSIRRQCELLDLARSGVYRSERAAANDDDDDAAMMRRIDALYLEYPIYGSRRMVVMLGLEGIRVNRKRVQRLMRKMGLEAIGPKPNTSKATKGHKIFPYLLRNLAITRPNQVWCTDITYVPIGAGFLYLVAIMDWASRAVLSWRMSNSMDTSFCVEALEEALARYGPPEIFNSDQGSQFTSPKFTARLIAANVKISMDGRGRWIDNVFIERLWRSLKWEDVYLKHYADGREARRGIGDWLSFYNNTRPHSALGNRMPMQVYQAGKSVDNPVGEIEKMMDNAIALPTFQQQHHQELNLAA
jgi:putative transposase